MKQRRPDPSESAPYYSRYTDLVPELDIVPALEREGKATQELIASIAESKASFRYAPDKWSIVQLIGHMEDSERVFAYRALSIGRGDTVPLPGFEQEDWMKNAPFDGTSLQKRAEGLASVRRSTVQLFREFDDAAWDRSGTASNAAVSVRALAYIILGHERHHVKVLREKYLR